MYKRALFILLALLVILVANACFAEAHDNLQAARDEILSLIKAGDFAAANAAIEQMKVDFADSPELPLRLYRIAYKYEEIVYKHDEVEALEQARALSAQIAADFPGNEYGINAALQSAKFEIYALIDAKNYESADSAVTQMATDFAGNKDLARRLYEIAHRYDKIATRYDQRKAFDYSKALCERIVTNHPEHTYTTYASLLLAKLRAYELIHARDYKSASSAVSQIMDDFAGHEQICRRLWEIANRYDKFKAFRYSKALCKEIVTNYPEDEYAAYAGLQSAKLEIYELIDAGDYESADLAVSQIISDFAGHKQHSRRLYEIAKRYEHKGGLANAKALYARIAADYPNDKYGSAAAIQLERLNIYEPIDAGNYEAADSAVSQMKADFNGHPLLFSRLDSIAERYGTVGEIAAAERIYEQVIQNHPDNSLASKAELGISRTNVISLITSQDYDQAEAAFDKMIADFNGHPDLAEAIFIIGEKYYYDALDDVNVGLTEQAKANFTRTVSVWDRIITEPFEPNSIFVQDAYYFAGYCYGQLGEYEKAIQYWQKIVDDWPNYKYAWNAQSRIASSYYMLGNSGVMTQSEAHSQIEQTYKSVVENCPDCPSVKDASIWLGYLNYSKGQWADAAMYFELFLEKAPDDQQLVDVLYRLGRAYQKMGELSLEAEVYSAFVEIADPNDTRIKTVMAELEKLEGATK